MLLALILTIAVSALTYTALYVNGRRRAASWVLFGSCIVMVVLAFVNALA